MDAGYNSDDYLSEDINITHKAENHVFSDDALTDCSDTVKIYSDCSCCHDLNSETDEEINIDQNEFDTSHMKNNRMMLPAAGLTVADVLFMVKMFSITKKTKNDENELLKLVKTLARPDFEE